MADLPYLNMPTRRTMTAAGSPGFHGTPAVGLKELLPGGDVKGVRDRIDSLLNKPLTKNFKPWSLDFLGVWVTSSRDHATIYGANVYEVEVPDGKYLRGSLPFQDTFFDYYLAKSYLSNKVQKWMAGSMRGSDPNVGLIFERYLRREVNLNIPSMLQQISQIDNAMVQLALKEVEEIYVHSKKYLIAWRDLQKGRGYDGVRWVNSKLDVGNEDAPHDAYLLWRNLPVKAEESLDVGGMADAPARIRKVLAESSPSVKRILPLWGIMSSSLDSLASRVAQKWAREKGEFGPPAQRGGQDGSHQHTQLPQKKREDARRYKSTPKTKRDSKAYYHLVCKKKPKCMQRREEYRQNPEKYKRRTSPLREAASLFLEELRTAGDLILYDQENPANNEIKQPGANVGYEATSPINYSKSPDKKDGVPPSHALPEMHHDDANPSSSRVIPDSMKENLQDSLTYMDGGQHINASHRVSRKSAALISEIFQNCSPDLLLKSKEVQYDRKSLGPNGMSVWTSQGSKGDSYTIRVKPVPKSKSMKIVSKMPVQVSCSCPFFQWQGPEHWAKTHNYLYGKPVGSATKPSKKDPSGKHWACKHVLAVLELVRKQRFANTEEFSWEGELTPFPGSVFSPSRVASYAAIRRLIPGIVKPLFHATTGPRAGNIAFRGQGIKANSGFSDFGGQVGISFSRDLSFLLAGSFGRYIFIVDENEISQRYVVKPYQHPSVPDEREERVYASVIPLSQIRGLIVNDKIYPFEAKELSTLPFPVVYKNKGGIWVRAS